MYFRRCLGIFVIFFVSLQNAKAARRSRTSTTTEASEPEGLTLAEREENLLDREQNFRTREAVFRKREETLSGREEAFKDREDKLSKREQNIEKREQNTVRVKGSGGTCNSSPGSAEEVYTHDYSLVRHDTETMAINDIGQVGTCSENMRFFAIADNDTMGQCDCDYHQCSRPLLYSDKYKQCFWAWSQGPCEQKEWYIYDENLMPVCEPNPCPETQAIGTPSYYFKSPEDQKCYKAGTKGPCTKKGERLFSLPDDPIPKCQKQALCPAISVPATQQCIPGNRRYFEGRCFEDVADE